MSLALPRSLRRTEGTAALGRHRADQGQLASPYSAFVTPADVTHLVPMRPPHSWGPWFEAWKSAVPRLVAQPTPPNRIQIPN